MLVMSLNQNFRFYFQIFRRIKFRVFYFRCNNFKLQFKMGKLMDNYFIGKIPVRLKGYSGHFFSTFHLVVGKPKRPPNIPSLGLLSSKNLFGFIFVKNTYPFLSNLFFFIGFIGMVSTTLCFKLKHEFEIIQCLQSGFFGLQTAFAKSIKA